MSNARYIVTIGLTVSTIALTACADPVIVQNDPQSLDYKWELVGGHNGYQPQAWQDSSVYVVMLDRVPVPGLVIHYRATAGTITPATDTSSDDGLTTHVWRLPTTEAISGEVFACVEAPDGCVDHRLIGFNFIPEQ